MAILTLEQVRKDLGKRRQALMEDIASGLPTMDEYNKAVGTIHGLDTAMGVIDRYINRLVDADASEG